MAINFALYQEWLSQHPGTGYESLAKWPGHRHAAAGQTPPTPFAASHISNHAEVAGTLLADHDLDVLQIANTQRRWVLYCTNAMLNTVHKCPPLEARCRAGDATLVAITSLKVRVRFCRLTPYLVPESCC